MRRILCISGPNLRLLGTREPGVYGKETLAEIHGRLTARASELGVTLVAQQSNREGEIVDFIGDGFELGRELVGVIFIGLRIDGAGWVEGEEREAGSGGDVDVLHRPGRGQKRS